MKMLIVKEYMQLRSYLSQIYLFLLAAGLLFGRISPEFMTTYFYVFPVVTAMSLPQMSFTVEEKGSTFVFLRTLPLRPWEIVGAKYAVSFITTLSFLILMWFFGSFNSGMRETLPASIAVIALLSSLTAALSFLFHFWLGIRKAKNIMLLLAMMLALPAALSIRDPRGIQSLVSSPEMTRLISLIGSPVGIVVSLLIGLCVMTLSAIVSTRIFAGRDITTLTRQ